MKYSADHPPLYCPQATSRWWKYASKMKPLGVLWHSTGANNPYIWRYVQPSDDAKDKKYWLNILGENRYHTDWNHTNRQAGVNAWVGKLKSGDVTSVQAGPWDNAPWGCGSGARGSCNWGWIQFEICEDTTNDPVYFNMVYLEAVELTAYLCKIYNLDPQKSVQFRNVTTPTILDHRTSHILGLGSNHGDVNTWFSKYGKTMQHVRNDVQKLLEEDEMTGEEIAAKLDEYYSNLPVSKYAEEAAMRNIDRGLFLDGDGDGLVDDPGKPMTREDFSLVLDRLINLYGLKKKEV